MGEQVVFWGVQPATIGEVVGFAMLRRKPGR
jgi:hypothetical protein